MALSTKTSVDIKELLVSIHLEMYYPYFQQSGYITVYDRAEINNELLQQIGISLTGHRKRIIKQLEIHFSKMEDISVTSEDLLTESDHSNKSDVNATCCDQSCLKEKTISNRVKKTHQMTEKLEKSSEAKGLRSESKECLKHGYESSTREDEYSTSLGGKSVFISDSSLSSQDTSVSKSNSCERENALEENNEEKDTIKEDNSSDLVILTALHRSDESDSGSESSFVEFQGEMISNELYDGMKDLPKVGNPKLNAGPTRSFILRNRPVPQIPGSSDSASFGSCLPERSPQISHLYNAENPYALSQTDSSNEKSSYINTLSEDTYVTEFTETENEETDEEDVPYSTSWKWRMSRCQEQKEMPSQAIQSTPTGEFASESEYSTVEDCARSLRVKNMEAFKSNSLPTNRIHQGNMFSYPSQSHGIDQPPETLTLSTQDDTSISPYACFYGSSEQKNKCGWLDKLSPQGNYMFQKRWVKFDGVCLSYYNNDKEVYSKGIIPVSAIKTVHSLGESKFEVVTSLRKYVFRVEKEGDRNDWVSQLQNALKYQTNVSTVQTSITPDKSSYLDMKGYKGKIYVMLNKHTILLCKNEQDYNAGLAITNIPLNVANIKHLDRKSFELTTPFRSFSFTADSEKEKQEWIEAVQESIAETLSDYEVAEKIWFNESNRSCADCQTVDPDWASINLCVVICKNCAGPHRSLGPKISKVRSLKLDATIWSNELVELFIVVGNKKANSFWAANLPPNKELYMDSTQEKRQHFIMQKYKEGRFRKHLSSNTQQQLNQALCAAVERPDVMETMTLVFSGADVMCATGNPIHSTPYLLAKKAGQRLQMEFLYHNKFSDYPKSDPQAEIGFHPDSSQSTFLCGFLYKASNAAKPGPEKRLKEDMNKRWCTMEGGFLSYYENDKTATPNGMIDLHEVNCLVVHKADSFFNTGAIFTFEIYLLSERVFLFGTETVESQREWTQAVAKHFVPSVAEHLTEREYDLIGHMYYKDCQSIDQWKKCWFALEKSFLHYCPEQENPQNNMVYLRRLQELTASTVIQNGNKLDVLLLVEKGRTLYIHGHTKMDFMVWHSAIEKAAGTDGNAIHDQQLGKNDVPIIVNSCIAFVTQYGLGSKSLYLKNGSPPQVRELLEQFKKDARSVKLRIGTHQLEDVTDVLKCFLFEIEDALLTKELYPYWISALDTQDEKERVDKYRNFIQTLPPINRTTLAALMEHLYRVWKCSEINCLDTHNLAMAFSSCLFQTEGQNGEEVSVIEDLINNYVELFQIKEDQVKQMDIENNCITKWKDTQVSLDDDVLIEVYLDKKDSECCVQIRVSPTMEADELTKTVLRLKNITPTMNDIWATFEAIHHGELERPLHYREKVLEPVLQWSSLSEPGSAYLIVKKIQMTDAIKPHIDKNATAGIKAGYLKFKEEPSKLLSGNKFQERYFVLQEGKLFLYKDMKNSKPEKFLSVITSTFYLGVKRKMKPLTSWGFTALAEKQQWLLCCDGQDTQMEWFISILMAQHNNDIWPPAGYVHTPTATKRENMEGISFISIHQEQNPVKMRDKAAEKSDVQVGKLKLGELWAKDTEEENSSMKQRASIVAHCLERKDEKVRSQAKKHRSMIGLDTISAQGGKLQHTATLDSKTQKKKDDTSMQETMVINKLPSNVMQELNLVLQKSRGHKDSL